MQSTIVKKKEKEKKKETTIKIILWKQGVDNVDITRGSKNRKIIFLMSKPINGNEEIRLYRNKWIKVKENGDTWKCQMDKNKNSVRIGYEN